MWSRFLDPSVLLIFLAVTLGLVVVLLIVTLVLWMKSERLERKLTVFFSGKEAKDLETILMQEKEAVQAMDEDIQELFTISNSLHQLGQRSLHKSAVMRFNPFKEVGGNQSFAVALLDGRNSGVVISSLHTRESTRVYAKPVKEGEAEGFPFTEEEKAVITEARHAHREKKV